MTTATKKPATKKQPEITAPTVNRVISKETGKVLGYLVASDSQPGVWYQVTWNRETHSYACTCPSVKPCKHERAVSEVAAARKALEAEKKAAVAEAEKIVAQPVATVEVEEPHRYCDACQCVGHLTLIDGLYLCKTCAEATKPKQAPVAPPTKATAPLRGSSLVGFPQQKNVPAPRRVAVPMR